jgi:pimeloyl-ACP methyl ester carboxylesterase
MQVESMHRGWRLTLALVLAATLAACGGGGASGDGVAPPPPVPDPTGPGELRSAVPLGVVPRAQVAQAIEALGVPAPPQPAYDVAAYRLEYLTTDADGSLVPASGLLAVPVKPPGARSPVLSYQHPTLFRNAEAPSNNAVPSELSIVFASLGYLVAAPDYVGYGVSLGRPHPYLLAGPSAAAVVDFLTAAASWRRHAGVSDNGQLFLAGYSEGGYVSVAAHRALQAAGSSQLQSLRLVVAGGGPYDVQATLDGLLELVRDENPVLGALIDPGLLRYLGSSLREEVREELLKHLLPDDADVVLDTRFIDRYLADDKPAIAQQSSVHDWRPAAPVRLFHGRDDRTVPYASAASALQAMQANGAGELVSLTDCPVQPASHLGCVPGFLAFLLGQLAGAAQDL